MNNTIFKNVLFFLLLLITFNSCELRKKNTKKILINKGVLDLQSWDFSSDGIVKLKGHWEFFPKSFIINDSTTIQQLETNQYLEIPGTWNKTISGKSYASLRLLILLPKHNEKFALKIPTIFTASEIYVNKIKIGSTGKIASTKKEMVPQYKPHIAEFVSKKDTLEIVLHISNFYHKKGGVRDIIEFGRAEDVKKRRQGLLYLEFFLVGAIFFMAFYHIGLFLSRRKEYAAIYFAIFSFWIATRMLVTGEYPINLIHEFNWHFILKIEYLAFFLSTMAFVLFINALFPDTFNKHIKNSVVGVSLFLSVFTILSPASYYTETAIPFQIFVILTCLYIIYVLFVSLLSKQQGAVSLLLGFLIMFLSILNDILYNNNLLYTFSNMTTFGLFIFIFSQAFVLVLRFNNAFIEKEKLANELDYNNKNLEQIVETRTAEIENKNKELEKQYNQVLNLNKRIENQRDEILVQKDNLQLAKDKISKQKELIEKNHFHIKESVNYASRIQNAIFHDKNEFNNFFKSSFILHKPKDVVSGDFYWFKKTGNDIIVIVADCTGHGVPGAFMSILGISLLNEVIQYHEKINASEILNLLRDKLKKALKQTGKSTDQKDGIDISLCIINKSNLKMQFSGAHNPIYIIRNINNPQINIENIKTMNYENYRLTQLKGDFQPIGVFIKEFPFTNYEIQLYENDLIYMFSDGFVDQLGGKNLRKFKSVNFKKVLLKNSEKSFNIQHQILESTIDNWKSKKFKQLDDILIIGFKI